MFFLFSKKNTDAMIDLEKQLKLAEHGHQLACFNWQLYERLLLILMRQLVKKEKIMQRGMPPVLQVKQWQLRMSPPTLSVQPFTLSNQLLLMLAT
jgi:hypothetical protein